MKRLIMTRETLSHSMLIALQSPEAYSEPCEISKMEFFAKFSVNSDSITIGYMNSWFR